jgi:Fe2+ transport system protein FeoA
MLDLPKVYWYNNDHMRNMTLAEMSSGKKAMVRDVSGGAELARKLMHMGIYPGREVRKIGHLALRGPVTVKVGRSVVAIAHGMAQKIKVEME